MNSGIVDRGSVKFLLLMLVIGGMLSYASEAQALSSPLISLLGVYGDIPLNNTGTVEIMEDQPPPKDKIRNVRIAVNGPVELTDPSCVGGLYIPYADAKGMFNGAEPHLSLAEKDELLTWHNKVSYNNSWGDLVGNIIKLSTGGCGGTDDDGNPLPCAIHPPGHADHREGVDVQPSYFDTQEYPTNQPHRYFWMLHLNGGNYLIQITPGGIHPMSCSDLHNCQCPPDASGTKNCDGTNPACLCYKADNGSVKLAYVPKVEGYQSGQKLEVIIHDRTPPHIQPIDAAATETDGAFPNLFMDPNGPKATTGDYCSVSELKVVDNASSKITTWFALNRKNGPTDPSKWEFDSATDTVKNGDPLTHVFIPDDMYGDMEYSMFAWDKDKNLNPGDSKIDEDQPGSCYGVQGEGDLGADGTFRFASATPDLVDRLAMYGPKHHGLAFIDDNDRPNFYVKIISKRDREDPAKQDSYALVFPPFLMPVVTGGLPPELTKLATMAEGVKYKYEDVYDPVNYATKTSFLDILELTPSSLPLPPNEAKLYNQFTDMTLWSGRPPLERKKYIAEQFRIESYAESDTNPDGTPRDGDEASFGLRNGFGEASTIFCAEPIIEDVEHEIWVWADDNVKFMNKFGAFVPYPYHGINELSIEFNDPRQKPPLKITKNISKPPDFWTGPIPVVFREPTTGPGLSPPSPTPVAAATCKSYYPSLKVTAKDYKGNKRELTILFNVMDQKAAVRVLEQKQLKQ